MWSQWEGRSGQSLLSEQWADLHREWSKETAGHLEKRQVRPIFFWAAAQRLSF